MTYNISLIALVYPLLNLLFSSLSSCSVINCVLSLWVGLFKLHTPSQSCLCDDLARLHFNATFNDEDLVWPCNQFWVRLSYDKGGRFITTEIVQDQLICIRKGFFGTVFISFDLTFPGWPYVFCCWCMRRLPFISITRVVRQRCFQTSATFHQNEIEKYFILECFTGWCEAHSLQIVSRRSIFLLVNVLMRNCKLFYWMEDLNRLLFCILSCIVGQLSTIWLSLCLASEGRRGCLSFRNSKAFF